MKNLHPSWIAVAILLFLIVFQFFYFSITATQIRTEIAAQRQELVKLTQPTNSAANTLGADTATQQQALVKDLNKKFSGYDQSLQSIVSAIQTLQKQVAASPSPSPNPSP